jgi:hypothetical protein
MALLLLPPPQVAMVMMLWRYTLVSCSVGYGRWFCIETSQLGVLISSKLCISNVDDYIDGWMDGWMNEWIR